MSARTWFDRIGVALVALSGVLDLLLQRWEVGFWTLLAALWWAVSQAQEWVIRSQDQLLDLYRSGD